MSEIKRKLSEAYDGLQSLRGVPGTRENMEILLQALYAMQEAWRALPDDPETPEEEAENVCVDIG